MTGFKNSAEILAVKENVGPGEYWTMAKEQLEVRGALLTRNLHTVAGRQARGAGSSGLTPTFA